MQEGGAHRGSVFPQIANKICTCSRMCTQSRREIQVQHKASYKSGQHVLDIIAEVQHKLIHSPVSIAHILSSPTVSVVHMSSRLLATGRLDTSAGQLGRNVALSCTHRCGFRGVKACCVTLPSVKDPLRLRCA